jgi:hypothetical protein
MDRQRLENIFPDYVLALSERLREAGWGYLADSVADVRIFGLSVGDQTCGLVTTPIPHGRYGALPIHLAEEIVEMKNDRIVYIEIRQAEPARSMVRSLTALAAVL